MTVTKTGQLFEVFIVQCAPKRQYDEYTQHLKARESGVFCLPTAYQREVFQAMGNRWFGWMLLALANLGNVGKEQMWYMTSHIKFLGLSRLGQDTLSSLGWANTLRYGDGQADDLNEKYRQQVR